VAYYYKDDIAGVRLGNIGLHSTCVLSSCCVLVGKFYFYWIQKSDQEVLTLRILVAVCFVLPEILELILTYLLTINIKVMKPLQFSFHSLIWKWFVYSVEPNADLTDAVTVVFKSVSAINSCRTGCKSTSGDTGWYSAVFL